MKGFYTAKEAQEKLGVNKDRFQYMVRTGRIQKVILPGRTYGLYPQAEVNRLAAAINATIEQYSEEATTFQVGTETDLMEIHALCARTMPLSTPVETMKRWIERNPQAFYTLRDNGILVGYVCLLPMDYIWLKKVLKSEVRIIQVPSEAIYPFYEGEPLNVYIRDLIVERGNKERTTHYAQRLIMELAHVITQLGSKGITIQKLYALATSPEGNNLCQGLHFRAMTELENPNPGYMPYELDMTTSESLLASEYRNALASHQESKKK
jgi:hypothetical protein